MEIKDIFALPWAIQLALGSGYAAYVTAYSGIRDHHKTIEITFATLVFSLVTTMVFVVISLRLPPLWAALAAFVVTVISGALWRKAGRRLLRYVLRATNVSWSDDTPSAWAAIIDNERYKITQISVELTDGTCLRCDDTARFEDAPFHGRILGSNGDIALYLTHVDHADGRSREMTTVRNEDYGDRITYVPAAQIRQIGLRYKS